MIKLLLVVLLAAAGAAQAAGTEDRTAPLEGPVAFWHLEVPNAWGVRQPTERIIRTKPEFDQLWDQLWQGYDPLPRIPPVDFAKEAVIVLALGAQPSGGYSIKAESITLRDSVLDVVYTTSIPGTGCVTSSAMTAPAVVLRFSLPAPQPRFRVRQQTAYCR